MEFFSKAFTWLAELSSKLPKISYKTYFIVVLAVIACTAIIVALTLLGSNCHKLKSASAKIIKYLADKESIDDENVSEFTSRCFSAKIPQSMREAWVQFLGVRFGYPSEIVSEQNVFEKEVKKHRDIRANVFICIALVLVAAFAFWGYGTLASHEMGVIHCLGLLLSAILYIVLIVLERKQYKKALETFNTMQEDLDAKVNLQVERTYAVDSSPITQIASLLDEIIARNTSKYIGDDSPLPAAPDAQEAPDAPLQYEFEQQEQIMPAPELTEEQSEEQPEVEEQPEEQPAEEAPEEQPALNDEQPSEEAPQEEQIDEAQPVEQLEEAQPISEELEELEEVEEPDEQPSAEEQPEEEPAPELPEEEQQIVEEQEFVEQPEEQQDELEEVEEAPAPEDEQPIEEEEQTPEDEDILPQEEQPEDEAPQLEEEQPGEEEIPEEEQQEEPQQDLDEQPEQEPEQEEPEVIYHVEQVDEDAEAKPAKLFKLTAAVDFMLSNNFPAMLKQNILNMFKSARYRYESSPEDLKILDDCIARIEDALA